MIGERDWRAAPDDSMETSCFLVLRTGPQGGTHIREWQVGFGNTTGLVDIESASISHRDREAALLEELLEVELEPHRHGSPEVTVITPDGGTLELLRTRLLHHEIDASLRGLSHISVEAVVEDYFATTGGSLWPEAFSREAAPITEIEESTTDPSAVETLWTFWTRIGPFVPRRALVGTPL